MKIMLTTSVTARLFFCWVITPEVWQVILRTEVCSLQIKLACFADSVFWPNFARWLMNFFEIIICEEAANTDNKNPQSHSVKLANVYQTCCQGQTKMHFGWLFCMCFKGLHDIFHGSRELLCKATTDLWNHDRSSPSFLFRPVLRL